MKKLDSSLYKKKIENPNETVYEIITTEDNLGWGLAIADIGKSELHYHKKTKEFYLVLEGGLKVILDGRTHVILKSEGIEIPAGVKHKAKSANGNRARIAAFSFPAWTPEDHIRLNPYGLAHLSGAKSSSAYLRGSIKVIPL